MKKVGFTGTQRGLSVTQIEKLEMILTPDICSEFHHGDCIGADEVAAKIAITKSIKVICHPPINKIKRAFVSYAEIRKEKEYIARNHDIVKETDILIATPGELEEQLRSGTWATVRFARKLKRPIVLIFNNGKIKTENI